MRDLLIVAGLLVFSLWFFTFGVALVVQPSWYFKFLPQARELYRPEWFERPWNRIQMRALGLVFSLTGLMLLAVSLRGVADWAFLTGVNESLNVVLFITFFTVWTVGLLLFVLWRIAAVRSFVTKHFSTGAAEGAEWQRRETRVFCSLLFALVVAALIVAWVLVGQ